MSQGRDELVTDIMQHPWLVNGEFTGDCPSCPDLTIEGGYNSPSHAGHIADALIAAGWVKPRTIDSAYEDYGPDSLPPMSAVLSGGKPAIRQHDGTWMDYDGSSWDDWEMEYPMTVIHEATP